MAVHAQFMDANRNQENKKSVEEKIKLLHTHVKPKQNIVNFYKLFSFFQSNVNPSH